MTLVPAAAPLTPVALVLCGGAGLLAGIRRLRAVARSAGSALWPAAAALAVYLIVCAPVLLAGRARAPGYLLDTTTAIQMAGADRLLTHGSDFGALVR